MAPLSLRSCSSSNNNSSQCRLKRHRSGGRGLYPRAVFIPIIQCQASMALCAGEDKLLLLLVVFLIFLFFFIAVFFFKETAMKCCSPKFMCVCAQLFIFACPFVPHILFYNCQRFAHLIIAAPPVVGIGLGIKSRSIPSAPICVLLLLLFG